MTIALLLILISVQSRGAALNTLPDTSFRYKQWTTEGGLPQNWIQCLAKDADGYIWLGTRGGLARFDGIRFTTFEGQLPSEVSPGFAKAFALDSEDVLWIATKRGLLCYRDRAFQLFSAANGLGHSEVTSVCAARGGGVWVGTGAGISRVRNGQVENYSAAGLGAPFIYSVYQDGRGQVWGGYAEGLARLDPATRQFTPVWRGSDPNEEMRIVRFISADQTHQLWFGTDQALLTLRPGSEPHEVTSAAAGPGDKLSSIFEDASGTLWLVKATGLCRLDQHGAHPFDQAIEAAESRLTSALQDHEGNYWLGTAFGGLWRMQPKVLNVFTTRDGLCDNEVWSVCAARGGGLWVGTSAGLCRYQNNAFLAIDTPDAPARNVRCVMEDASGQVWISTAFHGSYRLRPRDGGFEYVPAYVGDTQARAVYVDQASNVWTSGREALTVLRPQGDVWVFRANEFKRVGPQQQFWQRSNGRWQQREAPAPTTDQPWSKVVATSDPAWAKVIPPDSGLSSYDIRALLQDHSGAMWIATANGLNRLQDGRVTVYRRADGLPSDDVYSIHEDSGHTLWVGTDQGLCRQLETPGHGRSDHRRSSGRAPASAAFFAYRREHGFIEQSINAIIDDGLGFLWLSTRRGIVRIRQTELAAVAEGHAASVQSMTFGEAEGMLSSETTGFCQPSACKTSGPTLWFTTGRGLVRVNAAHIHENTLPPKVLIEELRTDPTGRPLNSEQVSFSWPPWRQTAQNQVLHLPPGAGRFVEIAYTATSLSAPTRVRFKCRLEGHDSQWIDAGPRRTAYYSNLPPGSYRFQVIACNNHDLWNYTGASLAFVIAPFWYETRIFGAAVAFGLIGTGAALVQLRHRRLRVLHELEKQGARMEERRRIARDLHDRMGSQLTRLIISESGGKDRPASGQSLEPTGRAGSLARQALQALDEVVWLTDPGRDTLQHTLEYLGRYMREFLEGTGTRLRLDIPLEIPGVTLSAATRRQILRIFEEALNNAVKHSGADEVVLGLQLSRARFIISLRDNGRGFPEEPSRSGGRGLDNMRERAAESGGELALHSTPGAGVAVAISYLT